MRQSIEIMRKKTFAFPNALQKGLLFVAVRRAKNLKFKRNIIFIEGFFPRLNRHGYPK